MRLSPHPDDGPTRSGAALKSASPVAVSRLHFFVAFFAVYFVWGSTYLSIRVLVATVPPLFSAGLRFTVAGFLLYLWCRWRGVRSPSRHEWRNLGILGVLMFLIAYGCLFWAEKSVPSGIASVLVATIPVWTAIFEVLVFRKQRLTLSLVLAVALGLIGVSLLALNSGSDAGSVFACLALLGGAISWAFGTVLSNSMTLPASKPMSAAGQMLAGGALLLLFSALLREVPPVPNISLKAALALLYLIVAGSLLAFTAYIWLLGHLPATKVASYAYVNPVVALALGIWLGGEAISQRMLFGAALVLVSILLLLVKPTVK